MSNLRQSLDPDIVRTYGLTLSDTVLNPPASDEWCTLVYASHGVLKVSAEPGYWIVPPHRAVWLPAGIECRLEIKGRTALRMIYLRKSYSELGDSLSLCSVVNVSALLKELILRVVRIGALYSTDDRQRRIAELIWDEIQTIDRAPLQLPHPSSASPLRFVESLNDDAKGIDGFAKALSDCGTSRRTLERAFQKETGMSLGQWRRRRDILIALQMIAQGETVSEVSFQLGYSIPSSFLAMFKRELGSSPGEYMNNSR